MELFTYDLRSPNTHKNNVINTALAFLSVNVTFKASTDLKASTYDTWGGRQTLLQEFTSACNGKVSLMVTGKDLSAKTIDLINSQEFSNVAELYASLGSGLTFTHVSDSSHYSLWSAAFKIAVGDGTLPLGEHLKLGLNFEGFENVEWDLTNFVSYDTQIRVSASSVAKRATMVHQLKNFTILNGQVTEVDLNGVYTISLPVDVVKTTTTYYDSDYQHEMLEEDRKDWIRTETSEPISIMGTGYEWYKWHTFGCSTAKSIRVTASTSEKCYGFILQYLA